MAAYKDSIEINAPVETVSGILLDLSRWTSWTSTVTEATPLGKAVVVPGARVRVRQPRLPVSVWTVDRVDRSAFEWNNLRHGLRTVASHRLETTPTGSRLSVEIDQNGPLSAPVSWVYGRVIRRHLHQMTEQLKATAESAAGTEALDPYPRGGHAEPHQQLGGRLSENR